MGNLDSPMDLDEPLNEEWVDCWQCDGTGFVGHDCGDDTCCCLHPEDNVVCDVCEGNGGWNEAL